RRLLPLALCTTGFQIELSARWLRRGQDAQWKIALQAISRCLLGLRVGQLHVRQFLWTEGIGNPYSSLVGTQPGGGILLVCGLLVVGQGVGGPAEKPFGQGDLFSPWVHRPALGRIEKISPIGRKLVPYPTHALTPDAGDRDRVDALCIAIWNKTN